MRKSDGLRVHHEKERWGEFTIRKSDRVRVTIRKGALGWGFTMRKSDRVRVRHEKKSNGARVDHEKKAMG